MQVDTNQAAVVVDNADPPMAVPTADAVLSEILSSRAHINALLKSAFYRRIREPYFLDACSSCVTPGRKVRSTLFLRTLEELGGDGCATGASDVIFAIECSHAASVLVDDLIDWDDLRHGEFSVQRSWGPSKTVLFAHYLSALALAAIQSYDGLSESLLSAYSDMVSGEVFDALLPEGDWIEQGYTDLVARKTFPLFEFSLHAAGWLSSLNGSDLRSLRTIGRDLGRMYQFSNDYHDWQIGNLTKRHLPDASWPITFSLPLGVYLKRHGPEPIRRQLERKVLPSEEWATLLREIWQPEIDRECLEILHQSAEHVRSGILWFPPRLRAFYLGLVDCVIKGSFWYHSYDRALECRF